MRWFFRGGQSGRISRWRRRRHSPSIALAKSWSTICLSTRRAGYLRARRHAPSVAHSFGLGDRPPAGTRACAASRRSLLLSGSVRCHQSEMVGGWGSSGVIVILAVTSLARMKRSHQFSRVRHGTYKSGVYRMTSDTARCLSRCRDALCILNWILNREPTSQEFATRMMFRRLVALPSERREPM